MRKSIFHEDWWLDALAPGCWREVTCHRGGQVAGALRFVERYDGGMKICEMPQITRVLGPIVFPQLGKAETRTRSTQSVVAELLQQIAGHDHVEMMLDHGFADLAPFLHAGYQVGVHPTFILNCAPPTRDLWAGLRDKTRNLIRRAQDLLTVHEIENVSLFGRFYAVNIEAAASYFDLQLMSAAVTAARDRQQCKIFAATDKNDLTHAMVAYIWDDSYAYYFLSSRKRSAHPGAVSLLLWTGIELSHSRGLRLDFDGGLTKHGRYKFLVAFGGQIANRFEVKRSTQLYQIQRTIRRIPRAITRRLWTNRLLTNGRINKFCFVLSSLCFS